MIVPKWISNSLPKKNLNWPQQDIELKTLL